MNAWFWSKRKVITLGGETAIANTRERKGKSSLFFHKKLFKTMEVKAMSSDKTVGSLCYRWYSGPDERDHPWSIAARRK